MNIELAEARGLLLMVKSGRMKNYAELARRFRATFGFGPHGRGQISMEWQVALDIAAEMAERLAELEMSDLDRVAHMEKCNWTPAVTYWTERSKRAEAACAAAEVALLSMEEERDRLALQVASYAAELQKVVEERDALKKCCYHGMDMTNHHNAAMCPYCNPDYQKSQNILRLLPEVIASLGATGCNVSLVADLRKAAGL
jgi:hypothetical protein